VAVIGNLRDSEKYSQDNGQSPAVLSLKIMKAIGLIVLLLLPTPVYGITAPNGKNRNVSLKLTAAVDWRTDCAVNVYFVQNMFSVSERLMVWSALKTWSQRAKKKGREISFVPAGDTGGLIDCVDCLTIARSVYSVEQISQRASFNALRQDGTGRLISAWIGFQRAGNQMDLKTVMLQTLERGLSSPG
jgi:hypothetical protein